MEDTVPAAAAGEKRQAEEAPTEARLPQVEHHSSGDYGLSTTYRLSPA